MDDVKIGGRDETAFADRPSYYGVHHLALNTDDMKMTVDFYVGVLGMRLVHAMKVPPGVGTGPGNRGNPPFEEIRHYFFDMGRDGLLAYLRNPQRCQAQGRPRCDRHDAACCFRSFPRGGGSAARAPH
jgi:catechol 2,3-dioxygenase-like lactoylglutathione lyase family enzyme